MAGSFRPVVIDWHLFNIGVRLALLIVSVLLALWMIFY